MQYSLHFHPIARLAVHMLSILNIAFFVGHNLWIAFNLTGWIWPRTRKWHLATLGATLFSWLIMGIWRGWGYCLCADWHFQVRSRMGIHGGESSYTELLFNQLPGVTVSRQFADIVTVGGLVLILIATAIVWGRAAVQNRKIPSPETTN